MKTLSVQKQTIKTKNLISFNFMTVSFGMLPAPHPINFSETTLKTHKQACMCLFCLELMKANKSNDNKDIFIWVFRRQWTQVWPQLTSNFNSTDPGTRQALLTGNNEFMFGCASRIFSGKDLVLTQHDQHGQGRWQKCKLRPW